jgi:hypothetical protein
MAPHWPSANAIPAPTLYTLQGTEADDTCFNMAFEKSIIMTEHVDYESERMCAKVPYRNLYAPAPESPIIVRHGPGIVNG